MTLRLQTKGACDVDPGRLLEVFGGQRQRFAAVLRGFGSSDWAALTRCAEWSAQDVVRHLCDANMKAIAMGPDDRTLDRAAGFDPRVTPRQWLAASAGEPPDATLSRFVATTKERLAADRARLAQGRRFEVRLPYGSVDWKVRELHGFWDSWVHERDVLLARGTEHPTDGEATLYAAAYGLFIAATVAAALGDPVKDKLALGGDGGGVFELDVSDGVTLTATRVTAEGPPAAQVTDALAGRSTGAAVLGDLPASSRTALSHLANFFNTPVDPPPS